MTECRSGNSDDPRSPASLTSCPDQWNDPRLSQAVQAYLEELEAGRRADCHEFATRYGELAEPLERCLEAVDIVQGMSARLGLSRAGGEAVARPEQLAMQPDGMLLGGFRLVREIGRGGMGVVYEAEEVSLGRRVALKILPFAAMLDRRRLERFRHEARAAAMLKHPHIVSVYSVGCEHGVHYYAMELVDGLSLAELMAGSTRSGGLPASASSDRRSDTAPLARVSTDLSSRQKQRFRTAAALARQAAEALHYAHQQGVIHRDIKPSNLLVDEAGELHIADFGLARIHDGGAVTLSGDVLGTLRYMSPEQAEGTSLLDHRTDVCSLGLTLYELATGHPAYAADSRERLLAQVTSACPIKPSTIAADMPRDLETIIFKAIEPSPASRYASADELAQDLERFLDARPIQARRASWAERASRWVARNPAFTGLLSIVALLLLFLSLGSTAVAWRSIESHRRQQEINLRQEIGLYAKQMRLVNELLDEGRYVEAERRLLDWVRSPSGHDHRDWEWYHLWLRGHDSPINHSIAHRLAVFELAFTKNASDLRLVVGWFSNQVAVWDCAGPTPRLERKLPNGGTHVCALVAIPDSDEVVAGDSGGNVVRWDVRTGAEVMRIKLPLPPDRSHVIHMELSPDQRSLAVSAGNHTDGIVCLFDAQTRDILNRLDGFDGVPSFAFTPQGDLLVASRFENKIHRYSGTGGAGVVFPTDGTAPLPYQNGASVMVNDSRSLGADGVRDSAVSPDGKLWALGVHTNHGAYTENGIVLWDLDRNERIGQISLGASDFPALAFSADSDWLIVGNRDGQVFVLDIDPATRAMSVRSSWQAHAGGTFALAIAPDGKSVASGGPDGHVRFWNLQDRADRQNASRAIPLDSPWFTHGAWVSADTALLVDGQGRARLLAVSSGEFTELERFEHAAANMSRVAVSQDGRLAVVARGTWPPRSNEQLTGKVFVVDLVRREILCALEMPSIVGCFFGAISADGKYAACGTDRAIQVIDVRQRKIVFTHPVGDVIKGLAFSPDGEWLAGGGGSGGSLHRIHLPSMEAEPPIVADGWAMESVAFARQPGDPRMLVCGGDNRVKLFDVVAGELLREFEPVPQILVSAQFSASGRRIVAGSTDGKIRIWEADTGDELLVLDYVADAFGFPEFSPDGRSLLVSHGPQLNLFSSADPGHIGKLSVDELVDYVCTNILEGTW